VVIDDKMINALVLFDKQKTKQLTIAILLVGIMILAYSAVSVYASGLGGYISEKLISSSGTTNSAIVIDRFGVSGSNLDVTMGPVIGIMAPSSVTMDALGTHATLRGSVTSLNGFPTSNIWFEWGYTPAYGSVTATQVANVAGIYTATINHYIGTETIYYRFVGQTDGTNYSNGSSFNLMDYTSSGGNPVTSSLPLMQTISLIFVAGIILFMLLALREVQNPLLVAVILAALVLMGISFLSGIQSLLNSLF